MLVLATGLHINSTIPRGYYLRVAVLCLICGLVASTILTPNIAAQTSTDEDDVLRVSTELLLFPIRIRDKHGQAVPGLTESDLALKDKDNVTSGLYFSHGVDQVALVFALDQSGSLREIISAQRDAALALFGRFNERSRVAVLRFTETPSVVAPFDQDTSSAREAFIFPAERNRRTAIFDAAAESVKMFKVLPRVRSQRHIVILISDGLDNASRNTAGSVIDAALEKRVSFYVIHIPLFEPRDGRLAVRPPAKGFRDLAEKTGGKYFLVGDASSALATEKPKDLTPVFQAIEEDLRSQYLLGFYIRESARDGRRHRFSLGLAPKDVEYAVGRFGYSRSHDFFVDLPPGTTTLPN
jgi:Ca-activated chloride channel family protein